MDRPVPISSFQFEAIDSLFMASGDLLDDRTGRRQLPRAFIGSSSEGLPVAKQLQLMLTDDLATVIWNQGTVFSLAQTTIESLERAVLDYDYGIFVVTPDDRLEFRGTSRDIARDNVVFELGLFVGKLTRHRTVVVQAEGVSLPSDLSGLTTARYDPHEKDLTKALGPATQQIKSFLGRPRS